MPNADLMPTDTAEPTFRLVGSYVTCATMGMYLWDILINLANEYRLILRWRFGFVTFVYFWARYATVLSLTSTILFFTMPLGEHCSTVATAILAFLTTFISAEMTLLFYRLKAIFYGQNGVINIFLSLLLIIIGFSAFIPLAGRGFPVSSTDLHCTASVNVRLAGALVAVPWLFSTLVFVAVSYKLFTLMPPVPEPEGRTSGIEGKPSTRYLKAFWRARDLPMLSRTLVQDGQQYILIFLLTTLVTVLPMAVKDIPVIYKFIFIAPHVAIENSMNSYMFRSLRARFRQPILSVTDPEFQSTLRFKSGTVEVDRTRADGDADAQRSV